jgi:para-aminobenzoate synthetase component 2
MAMRHRELPVEGVQFHPESVLTDGGHRMLANWLAVCGHTVPQARVTELENEMRKLASAAYI